MKNDIKSVQEYVIAYILTILIAISGLTACTQNPVENSKETFTPPATGLTVRKDPLPTLSSRLPESVMIYQLVIRRLCTVDDTCGGKLEKPAVYIISTLNDNAAYPLSSQFNPTFIPEAVQQDIVVALADLPSKFIWIDSFDEVNRDNNAGFVEGGGVIITLGNINFEGKAKAYVPADIYISTLAGGSQVYVVENNEGTWEITGNNGPVIIR